MVANMTQREERRGTRHIMLWWGVGVAIVLAAAAAVWLFVFVPQGKLGASARQTTSRMLANQGSGESAAAKNDMITPEQHSATGGSGQSASGEARQIEQTAGALKLAPAQRQQIHAYFAGRPAERLASADFALTIGAAVPHQVQLQSLPKEVSAAMGGFQGDQYVLVGDQLVIVDPSARRIVALVPNAG